MGAIVSDFPALPADADDNRVQLYQRAYVQLAGLGIALPAQPASTITRAQFLAHLQGIVGELVKAELTADPENVGYPGTDQGKADTIANPYQPNMRRWPGGNATGYRTAAGSLLTGLVVETNPGGLDPGFLGPAFADLERRAVIRFRNTTADVTLRGVFRLIVLVPASNQLTLGTVLPGVAVAAGEIFDLIQVIGFRQFPGRLGQIIRGIPYCPNALTAADIAAAQL